MKDEALKLALDALDNLLYWDNGKSDYDQAREAITAIKQALAAQPAPVQEPVATLFGSLPVYDTTPPAQPAVQGLPFGVGGGLVAIKTLLSRDPCVHANTAIEMIDAILKEHPAAQHQCKWPTCQSEEYQQALAEQINQELVTGAVQPAPVQEQFRDATKMIVAGNKMASIINTAITAPVDEWPTTYELDVVIKEWKQATTEDFAVVPPAAQPAPVQPVAQSMIKALTHAVEIAEAKRPGTWDDLLQYRVLLNTPLAAQPAVPDAIHHTDLSEHPQYIEGWNDCRAEMLKGMKP
jgi:hypothetical protein